MGIHEDRLFALLKEGESLETNEDQTTRGYTNVYPNPPGRDDQWGEKGPQEGGRNAPSVHSTGAVEGNKDTRFGVLGRVLDNKDQAAAAARALMAANLDTVRKGDYESHSPLLQKVSFPRSRTLTEQVLRTTGRL
jgi:hypothetical protein